MWISLGTRSLEYHEDGTCREVLRTAGGLEADILSFSVDYAPEATYPSVSSWTLVQELLAHLQNLAAAEVPRDTHDDKLERSNPHPSMHLEFASL